MTNKAIAAEIRKTYPKHSPAALSYALNTAETGVTLTPRARSVYNAFAHSASSSKPRRKCIPFRARLSPEAAAAVEAKMQRLGISSKQTLVEALLINWLNEGGTP